MVKDLLSISGIQPAHRSRKRNHLCFLFCGSPDACAMGYRICRRELGLQAGLLVPECLGSQALAFISLSAQSPKLLPPH
jgi:hypothetical protein